MAVWNKGSMKITIPLSGGSGGAGSNSDLGELESAYDVMVAMLKEWGLESLAGTVRGMLEDGRTSEQIGVLLQDTDEYKQRFAGNELRREKGLSVLSPADYLAAESSYRQIMESAGLPQGFYDSTEDFVEWIGNDVSPSEVKSRVDASLDVAWNMDADTAAAFKDYYGITENNLAAYFLDRERGLQELEKISRAGLIGGAAGAQGTDIARSRAERLAMSDLVAPDQYREAMGQVSRMARDVGRMAGIHGGAYTQRQAEEEVFFADEQARRRRERLGRAETAQFSMGSGASPESLARSPGQV